MAWAHHVATASTANATAYASGAFSPTAGQVLVALVIASGTQALDATMSDSQALGWTLVASVAFNGDTDRGYVFIAEAAAAAASMTVTFDCTSDAATGAVIFVAGIHTGGRVGAAAIRQSTTAANLPANQPPRAVFTSPALWGNPLIGLVGNGTNPATLTPPVDWTEPSGGDTGYATPTTGAAYAYRGSGFTAREVLWDGLSLTAAGLIVMELDTRSVGGTYTDATTTITLADTGPLAGGRYDVSVQIAASVATVFALQQRATDNETNVGDVVPLRVGAAASAGAYVVPYTLAEHERVRLVPVADITGTAEATISTRRVEPVC